MDYFRFQYTVIYSIVVSSTYCIYFIFGIFLQNKEIPNATTISTIRIKVKQLGVVREQVLGAPEGEDSH